MQMGNAEVLPTIDDYPVDVDALTNKLPEINVLLNDHVMTITAPDAVRVFIRRENKQDKSVALDNISDGVFVTDDAATFDCLIIVYEHEEETRSYYVRYEDNDFSIFRIDVVRNDNPDVTYIIDFDTEVMIYAHGKVQAAYYLSDRQLIMDEPQIAFDD